MGGRGASLGGSNGPNITIDSELDVWSYRHRGGNEPFVDSINTSVERMQRDFPELMESVNYVNAATLSGSSKTHILGYYQPSSKTVALNDNYTDIRKMTAVYDKAVQTGYHPSRGSKNGTEAVAFHEMGHALTGYVNEKMGVRSFDEGAKRIVDSAYKASGGKGGTKKWAGSISRYAQDSNAECIAEAVADYYCNGSKASSVSKAIMNELKNWR